MAAFSSLLTAILTAILSYLLLSSLTFSLFLWYFEVLCVLFSIHMLIDWACESYYYLISISAKKDLSKYGPGSWALITGGSDGIGLGFATILAQSGFNLVLISISQSRLDEVSKSLKAFSIDVRTIAVDISKCPENPFGFFNSIDEKTRDLDISIVINNVGTSILGYFVEITAQELADQNALNLWPVVYLTKIFVGRMMKRSLPSAILNVSSVSSLVPAPGFAMYGASKSFGHLFTLDVNEEVRWLVQEEKCQKIDVFSLQPGTVDTALTAGVKGLPLVISPMQCAERALSVLGKCNYSSGHWKSLMYSVICRNLPMWLNAKLRLAAIEKNFKRNKLIS